MSRRNGDGKHAPEMMNALKTMFVFKEFLKIQEKKVATKAALE